MDYQEYISAQTESERAGRAFSQAYARKDDNALELLERYKEARRKIPIENGYRFGAYEAHLTTQGLR